MAIAKQVKLPLSKAVEIAWKNIRMRLARSMLVTSGIVLAIAFLLAIQIGDIFADGMRSWIESARSSDAFVQLREEQRDIEQRLRDLRQQLRTEARAAPGPQADQKLIEFASVAGTTAQRLRDELGNLPVDADTLRQALTTAPDFRKTFDEWLGIERESLRIRDTLSAPQRLQAKLEAQGVPTTPDAVSAARLQQRWLLGLALLVAFVGILNAMLMSVTERFREIGTMKCLGALDGFIVRLFIIESLFQGVVGTIVGILLGLGISLLLAFATYGVFAFNNLPGSDLLNAVLVSSLIGVALTVAGAVWPAWQAARMPPIAAMRVEA